MEFMYAVRQQCIVCCMAIWARLACGDVSCCVVTHQRVISEMLIKGGFAKVRGCRIECRLLMDKMTDGFVM